MIIFYPYIWDSAAGSVPIFDSRKEDLCENGGGVLHIAESDVPDTKSADKREDILLRPSCKKIAEGMDNGSKSKHMLVFKASRRRFSDEVSRSKLSLETPVKVEKADRLDGRVSCKLNSAAACHVEGSNVAKGFNKQEVYIFCPAALVLWISFLISFGLSLFLNMYSAK